MISKKLQNLVKKEVRLWSKSYLEVPNAHLNRLPASPYAKKAWLDKKVDIQLRNPDKGYISNLHRSVKDLDFDKKEILIFCDLFYKEYSLNRFQKIIDKFNDKYNIEDVYFMGFHPYNPPNLEEQEFLLNPTGDMSNLPDSKVEFSMMLIQNFSQLQEASDRLRMMGYYDKWPRDYYQEVVESRHEQYKKLFM